MYAVRNPAGATVPFLAPIHNCRFGADAVVVIVPKLLPFKKTFFPANATTPPAGVVTHPGAVSPKNVYSCPLLFPSPISHAVAARHANNPRNVPTPATAFEYLIIAESPTDQEC